MKPAAKKTNTKAAKKPSPSQKIVQPARKKTAIRKKTTLKTAKPAIKLDPLPATPMNSVFIPRSQRPVLHRRPLLVYPK
jgi:hypothetical protein